MSYLIQYEDNRSPEDSGCDYAVVGTAGELYLFKTTPRDPTSGVQPFAIVTKDQWGACTWSPLSETDHPPSANYVPPQPPAPAVDLGQAAQEALARAQDAANEAQQAVSAAQAADIAIQTQ